MTENKFYEMLAKIHTEVSIYSCGCMGSSRTPEGVKKGDKQRGDYLGFILRKYITVTNNGGFDE